MGELIAFTPRASLRVPEMAERIAHDRPDLSREACFALAGACARQTPQHFTTRPKPTIAPDDPVIDLYDAFKRAQATFQEVQAPYQEAVRRLAKRHGRTAGSMAKLVQVASEKRRNGV